MKGHEFKALQSAIASLSDSTYLEIASTTQKFVLDGRCSPYVSHQEAQWLMQGEEHVPYFGLQFRNTVRVLILRTAHVDVVMPELPPAVTTMNGDRVRGFWVEVACPRYLVQDLLDDARVGGFEYWRWFEQSPFVIATFIVPLARAFDEAGKPVWDLIEEKEDIVVAD